MLFKIMKINSLLIIILICFTCIFSSCSITSKSDKIIIPSSPITTQINLDFDNLEYIGEATGKSEQTYLLGIIPIGNRTYQYASINTFGSLGNRLPNKRGYNNALYDALDANLNCDFVLPVSCNVNVIPMFLGRKEYITVKVKSFKIKATKKEVID